MLPMLLLLLLLLLLMLLLSQHICALLRANASDMGLGGGGQATPDLEHLMTMIKQGLGERAAAHDR